MLKIFTVLIFIFLFSALAHAQAVSSYLFLEVVDSNQKPVSDANVETPFYYQKVLRTNENGNVNIGEGYAGAKVPFPEFIITKTGYYPFQDFRVFKNYALNQRIKVELLKIPKTKEERELLGDEQLKRDFILAVQKGDTETVRKLIKSGISPNLSTEDLRGISGMENIPAIIFSAASGDAAMIEVLLKAGADVRRKQEYLDDILFYYLQADLSRYPQKTEAEKNKLMIEYERGFRDLVKAGANLELPAGSDRPLLIWAAENCDVTGVKLLIAVGVNIDAKNGSGKTALSLIKEYQEHMPTCSNYPQIIKILEAAGAKE